MLVVNEGNVTDSQNQTVQLRWHKTQYVQDVFILLYAM